MGVLVWIMVGLALWHFTIFLPDRFWGGIVGACFAAMAGAVVVGVILSGFSIPGRDETSLVTALPAVPGAVLGIAAVWFAGDRQLRSHAG